MPSNTPDTGPPPLSWPVQVTGLPPEGQSGKIEANGAERHAVAKFLDLLSLYRLQLTYRLMPHGKGRVRVRGQVEAEAEQACVITGDPVRSLVSEAIDLEFWPEDDLAGTDMPSVSFGFDDKDPPEPLIGGSIDLGMIAVEFLSLGLDPYPRRPGAKFVADEDKDDIGNPFAALAHLKTRPSKR